MITITNCNSYNVCMVCHLNLALDGNSFLLSQTDSVLAFVLPRLRLKQMSLIVGYTIARYGLQYSVLRLRMKFKYLNGYVVGCYPYFTVHPAIVTRFYYQSLCFSDIERNLLTDSCTFLLAFSENNWQTSCILITHIFHIFWGSKWGI